MMKELVEFEPYLRLGKRVFIQAIQDYYNMVNKKGDKLSRDEGWGIRKWVGSENFNLWCAVCDFYPKTFKKTMNEALNRIDKGEKLKVFESKNGRETIG